MKHVGPRVSFTAVRDKVRCELDSAADDPDLPELFDLCLNGGVGTNTYIDELTNYLRPPTSHLLPPTSYLLPPYLPPPTSYLLPPTSHLPPPTSYLLLPTYPPHYLITCLPGCLSACLPNYLASFVVLGVPGARATCLLY